MHMMTGSMPVAAIGAMVVEKAKNMRVEELKHVLVEREITRVVEAEGDFEGGVLTGRIVDVRVEPKGVQVVVRYEENDIEECLSVDELGSMLIDAHDIEVKMEKMGGLGRFLSNNVVQTPVVDDVVLAEGIADLTHSAKTRTSTGAATGKKVKKAGKRARTLTGTRQENEETRIDDDAKRGKHEEGTGTSQDCTPSRTLTFDTAQDAVMWTESGTRTAGLPGHIKQIHLVDFMCHENMTMDFCPHVTFISGTNGSGKSASLQALQCCLGVNATKHGKNASLSKIIRTGAEEAIIRVTVWNRPTESYDAYRHDLYGDFIVIERRIAHRSMSWMFKSASGRVISRKKEELNNILRCLNINASNPVTVMTQDTARGFLGASNAKADQEKFKLYMDATQLGEIAEKMTIVKHCLSEMSEYAEKIEEEYGKLEEEEKDVRERYESLKRLDDLRREIDDLEAVFTWECIEEYENSRQKLIDALRENNENDLAAIDQKIEHHERALITNRQKLEEKQEYLKNFGLEVDSKSEKKKELTAERKECTKKVTLLTKKVARQENMLQEAQEKKSALENSLKEYAATQSAEQANQSALSMKYLEEVDAAKNKVKIMRDDVTKSKEAIDAKEDELSMMDRRKTELGSEKNRLTQRGYKLKMDLQALKDASTNKVTLFGGPKMLQVLHQVQAAKSQFEVPPIGPIGQYLGLKDSKYAKAVEEAIGTHLNTFLVQNKRDFQMLNSIFRRCNLGKDTPRISIMNLRRPAYVIPQRQLPADRFTTLYSMLTCNRDDVKDPIMNFLIDIANVEKTALVCSFEEQKDATNDDNVYVAYDLDGSRARTRGNTRTYESYRMYERRPRLGMSNKDSERELLAEQDKNKQDLMAIEQQHKKLEREYCVLSDALKTLRDQHSIMTRSHRQADSEYQMLMSQPPPEAQTDDGNPEVDFQNELIALAQEITRLEEERDAAKQEYDEQQKRKVIIENELAELAEQMRHMGQANQDLVDAFDVEKQETANIERELVQLKEQKESIESNAQTLRERLEEIELQLKEFLPVAESISTREDAMQRKQKMITKLKAKGVSDEKIGKLMARSTLEKRLHASNKKIEDANREAGGALTDVKREYEEMQEKVKLEGGRMRDMLDLFKCLKKHAYEDRRKKHKEVDENVEKIVNREFKRYMRKKGHFGKIRVHRVNQTLTIGVRIGEKEDAPGAGMVKDLKQLSGGERSFATVAFALALGGQTEMPFRAMDEFDVFMDSINRRIAMENLLTFAKDNPHLQFVFLTPQDMTPLFAAKEKVRKQGVDIPDDFIHIVQMKPARP